MALDRQSIEKKDFPTADRGYDPAAVDAHLAALADEVEELKRSSGRPAGSLAASASEQVRGIVEAAEASAAEIRRQAERAAQQVREKANTEAREQAASQARGYIDRVSASTATTIQRLDDMKTELGTLLESLRTSAAPGTRGAPPGVERPADEAPPVQRAAAAETRPAAPPEPPPAPATPTDKEEEEGNGRSEDAESARLIALNMALNDTPREEVDRYIAEHYRVPDRGKLLDEVYASVHG